MAKKTPGGATQDTRTLVTVLLLIFVYPVGVIVMYFWSRWKTWVKILVSLPFFIILLPFLALFLIGFLTSLNPKAQVERASCMSQCLEIYDQKTCAQQCSTSVQGTVVSPSPTITKVKQLNR